MTTVRIYGSEAKCRAAVARYIASGDELLDQAVGVRRRLEAEADRDSHSLAKFVIEDQWASALRRWARNAQRGLGPYLQDQTAVLAAIAWGLPPETGKPRHHIDLDRGEDWLTRALEELRTFQAMLGVRRNVAAVAPAPARFEELHASGLIDAPVIDGYAKSMLAPNTPKQLLDAIGAAKELTEAVLRASLARLDVKYGKTDDLPKLMKLWRSAVGTIAPPDPSGVGHLDRAQAALGNLVTFLGEWRNEYGSGHGRPAYPEGLKVRHTRLAADAAETCVRFIVTTMDDLERLPP